MAIENWEKIQALFHQAADMTPAEQCRFLDFAGVDRATRHEVESLLARDRNALQDIPLLLETSAQELLGADPLLGTRIGPWRVVREIGRGGMGAVYLAARDDDQYHKEAALKLVKYGMDTVELLHRFRHERQILANLDHPYIARLIDGGSTKEGRPYLVMEYVAGKTIDQWCRDQALSVQDRCRLMLKVCEAVAYAHRNLVVHRDLKPGNIFITPDGTPKLLDFGVAKLLTPDLDGSVTVTQFASRALTPDYASPEQVTGQPMTTSTDVYSLGVILYELLTGSRALHVTSTAYGEVERAVCQTVIASPSESVADQAPGAARLRKQLAGDLDRIILMAIRKEAERRYPSVEQFADDIRRHLEGRPVIARPDGWRYRTGKFLQRNRLMLSAAGLVVISLLLGTAVAVSQARQAVQARRAAEGQRQAALAALATARQEHTAAELQRDAAVQAGVRAESEAGRARTEQQRAERRLSEIVELANHSLFDIHEQIARLPGATEARRQLVKTALDYLEQVSKDASNDQALKLALSAAYLKMGMVQGDPYGPSLGDVDGALQSFRKGAAMVAAVRAAQPGNLDALHLSAELQDAIGISLANNGKAEEGAKVLTAALADAESLYRRQPGDLRAGALVGALFSELSSLALAHNESLALNYAKRAVAAYTELSQRFPGRMDVLQGLSSAHAKAATAYAVSGEMGPAVEQSEETVRICEKQVAAQPDDAGLLRSLMLAYGHLGDRLGVPFVSNLRRYDDARVQYRKAVALAEQLARVDTKNSNAQYDLATALTRFGSIPGSVAAVAEALAAEQRAAGILEELMRSGANDKRYTRGLALSREYEGHRLRDAGRLADALAAYRKSRAMISPLAAASPADRSLFSQVNAAARAIIAVLAEMGDRDNALTEAREALNEAEKAQARAPHDVYPRHYLALTWATLGQARLRWATMSPSEPAALQTEDWSHARQAAEQALTQLRAIPNVEGNVSFSEGWNQTQKLLADCGMHGNN